MNRGKITRERLLEVAARTAGSVGLEGLTIGTLAHSAEMSKSGVFAHFGSKEELQLAVVASARQRFIQDVLEPSYEAPVGSPRLHALFERWMDWAEGKSVPGGCPILAASLEFSGRPGVVRDRVAHLQGELTTAVEKTVKIAVEEGHFRMDLDVVQFAYQMHCLVLGFQLRHHLLRRGDARACARAAFDYLVNFADKS
ncbi:MAG: TetR/AcrR family transcriptional regulator [Gemmatimonadota bacterium]|nr:TetR/AcrR family transcriptional regulator [Gemmatimonadota bacterium]